jgi:hypothetical protein
VEKVVGGGENGICDILFFLSSLFEWGVECVKGRVKGRRELFFLFSITVIIIANS